MTPAATFAIAKQFFIGYERCRGSGLPADGGQPNAIVPSIVCLAFAIETGLKAILVSSRLPAKIHRLDALFASLREEDRKAVLFYSGVEEVSFLENLAEVANAFVEWRYVYEHRGVKSISEQFLLMVWHAVEAVAQDKVEDQRRALR